MPLPIREEELDTITKKVYALYAKHGFDGISMDEVSAQTNISKATLYRYFTSKEDIVRGMAQFLIDHLDSVRFGEVNTLEDVTEGVREFYVKSVLIAALSGTYFLRDLEHKFPDSYKECLSAMGAMEDRFSDFYKRAVELGCFRDLPFAFVSKQFGSMLSTILNMDYLEENEMTLSESIQSYYRMFLCQILKEDCLFVTEKEETYAFTEDLANVLLEDFFLDSIRR